MTGALVGGVLVPLQATLPADGEGAARRGAAHIPPFVPLVPGGLRQLTVLVGGGGLGEGPLT